MKKRLLEHDLYSYLVSLSSILEGLGELEAAARVIHVSKFASGSTSELYGEARVVLPEIFVRHGGSLQESDRARLREVIAGIEREFARIGGG